MCTHCHVLSHENSCKLVNIANSWWLCEDDGSGEVNTGKGNVHVVMVVVLVVMISGTLRNLHGDGSNDSSWKLVFLSFLFHVSFNRLQLIFM